MTGVVRDQAAGAEASDSTGEPRSGPSWRRLPVDRIDALLAVAIVVAGAVRVWRLGRQSFWYDEWLTARAAHGTAGDLYRYVTDQAGIPPTYFAVMWGWARVFGTSEVALRSVSALAGIATVPVAYAAARELGQRRAVARAVALLVAVNPMLVWYSQEARPYSIVALLGALSLWALARVRTRGERRDLAVWALVCALTVSFHYFTVFLVAAETVLVVAHLRPWKRRPSPRELLATYWPAGVVLAVLAPFAIRQFSRRGNHDWITDHALTGRLREAGRSALVGPSYPDGRLWVAAAAVAALAIPLLRTRGDAGERRAAAVAAGLGLASVVMALAAVVAGVDVILGRYLIVALVPLAVAVAIGLCATRVPRWVAAPAVAALCALSLVTVVAVGRDPDLQRSDWQAVAAAHDSGGTDTGAGVRLLVLGNHATLAQAVEWYAEGGRPVGPDETVVVDQIDVVYARVSTEPCNPFVGLPCSLLFFGAALPEPVASQVHLAERIDLDQFWLERYQADRPVQVTPADLVPSQFRDQSLVLVTTASPR